MKQIAILILFCIGIVSRAQGLLDKKETIFTRQDTLRGSITKERAWWDLKHYHLAIKVNPTDSTIAGSNTIRYQVLKEAKVMQIDLQPPMELTNVIQEGKTLHFTREGNVYFITLSDVQQVGTTKEIVVFYSGKPKVAVNPPWDGGITWSKDANGNDFIASSCQGLGASVWWPNKDHMYDEADNGMMISVNVPGNLTNVSNGRLRNIQNESDGTRTFHWEVVNPINNYGVNINIGDYVSFSDVYKGEKGNLDCTYFVLRENLEKAKKQFQEVPKMLKAFEHWFGPYPFYEDSFKLVEVPYLGMEHQSSVTYGNKYQNGYLGSDLSSTGWGLKFDFIIIHESGHEWFANNITYKDIADMWIHESFTAYSESLFLEYYFGKEAASEYVKGVRQNIENDKPIIGKYNVNNEGSGDMYYKGANMLHTLRQVVSNDEKWRTILRGLNKTFYHQTVTSLQIENYLSEKIGKSLTPFFNQYLRDTRIPTLEYYFKDNQFGYRWINVVADFSLPIIVYFNGKKQNITPSKDWKTMTVKPKSNFTIDDNYYVKSIEVDKN